MAGSGAPGFVVAGKLPQLPPEAASHSLAVRSLLAVTIYLPSGENEAIQTGFVCPTHYAGQGGVMAA